MQVKRVQVKMPGAPSFSFDYFPTTCSRDLPMSPSPDYTRYKTLRITRRGPADSVLDIQMRADVAGGNGKLPTAGHDGHWELAEIWRDVGADDSVRCAVLRGDGLGFSGGGDLSLVTDMANDFTVRSRVIPARKLPFGTGVATTPLRARKMLELQVSPRCPAGPARRRC